MKKVGGRKTDEDEKYRKRTWRGEKKIKEKEKRKKFYRSEQKLFPSGKEQRSQARRRQESEN